MSKILVTGATGTIGKALIKTLQDSGASFVAGVRNTAKAKEVLGESSPSVPFDFADKSTYAAATEGVDRVFVLGPPLNPALGELVAPFLDLLKERGILRVVYLSANGAEHTGDALPFHIEMEQKLKAEGFQYTILRPSFFAQNFKNYEWENISQRSIIYAPAGEGKAGFVDVRDIAAVAAKALTEDGHTGKTYTLTGPEALSYHQAAEILSQLLGKPVHYPAPTPAQFAQTLAAAGAPPFVAQYMNEVYGMIGKGYAATITDDVERITGRKAFSLRQALEHELGVLA